MSEAWRAMFPRYAHRRGHRLVLHADRRWRWAATGRFVPGGRRPLHLDPPCVACGLPPTPEGYDACLGHIPGARAACCGHGVKEPYVSWGEGDVERGRGSSSTRRLDVPGVWCSGAAIEERIPPMTNSGPHGDNVGAGKMRSGTVSQKSTKHRRGEIKQAVLQVLADQGPLSAAEAVALCRDRLHPSSWELESYPSKPGVPKIETMIRYGTIGPVKAGWIVKDRGTWEITEDGRRALSDFPAPEDLNAAAARGYNAWKSGQYSDDQDDFDDDSDAPPESPGLSIELAEESALREIGEHIGRIPPYEFQRLVAALLRAMGYFVAWIAPPGKDGGVDIVALTDPLGANGPRIKVQVKRHTTGKITATDLRAFMAVLGQNDVGMFVTSTDFTSDAMAEARQQETRRVSLVGIKDLLELWIDHYEKIDDDERRLLPLRPVHFLALSGG